MNRLMLHLLLIPLFAVACAPHTTDDVLAVYERAAELNDRQEYLAAADSFHRAATMAEEIDAYDLQFRSTIAEGECYYMLDIVTMLRRQLNMADSLYERHSDKETLLNRLEWEEMLCKLRGSYYYLTADPGSDAKPEPYRQASLSYQRCFALLDSITMVDETFDLPEMAVTIHRELLSLYYKQKDYKRALEEAKAVIRYYGEMPYQEKPATAADQRLNSRILDSYLSLAMVYARMNEFYAAEELMMSLPEACLRHPDALRTRGKLLMLRHDHDGSVGKEAAKPYYEAYIRAKKAEAERTMRGMSDAQREQYWLSLHSFLFDCYRLEETAPEMLYNLALYSKGYLLESKRANGKPAQWSDIRSHLKQDACAIEFVQYRGRDERNQLGALVLTPKSSRPQFIHIADMDSLSRMRLSGQMSLGKALRSTNKYDKNSIYQNAQLPRRIWTDRLMQAIGRAKTVYFSPDGLLQQLAIEYLMPDTSKTCRRLSSTRMLTRPHKKIDTGRILLIGDVDYASASNVQTPGNDALAYQYIQPLANQLEELEGSRSEVEDFKRFRQSSQNSTDCILTRTEATDSAFCAQASHYPLILIDTHGFFIGTIEDGTDMKPIYMDHSLSQSGIALAGSRYALLDSTHNSHTADGILSAKELSGLKLQCDLMVLSACQTGLGYITADGVYGIQRALKQAGVDAMVVSLWSVSDEASAMLMSRFYRNLCNGMDTYAAFMDARRQLMTAEQNSFDAGTLSHRQTCRFADPQYTDAFILIDVL